MFLIPNYEGPHCFRSSEETPWSPLSFDAFRPLRMRQSLSLRHAKGLEVRAAVRILVHQPNLERLYS